MVWSPQFPVYQENLTGQSDQLVMNGTVMETHQAAFTYVNQTERTSPKRYCPPTDPRGKACLCPPTHKKKCLKNRDIKQQQGVFMPASRSVGFSSPQLQTIMFHADGVLRKAPNVNFCCQINYKLMTLQKFFENYEVPFCAECMQICNLNEILKFVLNMTFLIWLYL